LLALIAAQFRRYEHAQIFAFDKGKSLYPLTKAAGGDHYEIGAGEGTALAFCPLAELSTDSDRAWAAEWVETLVAMQGVTITPDHRNAIARQIGLLADARGRSLSDFVSGVQMREIKTALQHYTVDGPMGQLLDAEEDGLTLGSFQTFEVEELMNMGERNLVPVLLYLFRRIEKRLTGAPSLIILDEAWLMLGHPMFRDKIREWLKVLRKANCAVVLATQSISDAEQSGIIDVLKESCPTKICLPNGAARESGTREFYDRIGFNERQIEIVATAVPKREYYVASPEGRRFSTCRSAPWRSPSSARPARTVSNASISSARRMATIGRRRGWRKEGWMMPSAFSRTARIAIAALMSVSPLSTVEAGTSFVGATEWTQILNNGELVGLVGQSAEQIQNQVTQITQLAEQIQNQLRIYETCCRTR
jgi:type IV secretory pathway VirB4 component